VKDVRSQPVGGKVAERGATGELVGAQELGVLHAGGFAHPLLHQVVKGYAARLFGHQREYDVAAVAVGEPLPWRELGRIAVEHPEELLGGSELVDGHGEDVVGDLVAGFLVYAIADARPVREQLLDRHLVTDQRQVVPQHRPGGGGRAEHACFDEAHHREGGQSFAAARDRELGIDRGSDPVAAMGQTVRLGEVCAVTAIDPHHARKPSLGSNPIDRFLQVVHAASLSTARGRSARSGCRWTLGRLVILLVIPPAVTRQVRNALNRRAG
jgi:hypothetical protein